MSKENMNNISENVQRSVLHAMLTIYELERDDEKEAQENVDSFLDRFFGDE